jgi:excisionase family DNA binding protein
MHESTIRAIVAIMGTDPTITGPQREHVLKACREPDGTRIGPQHRSAKRYITAKQAAEILCTSPRTVWRLVRLGKIKRIKLGYRCTRFHLEDVENMTSVDDGTPTDG